jgi:hypothetical protein
MLARQSSASNGEQQELEREVLDSIFAADFSVLAPAADGCRRWRLAIAPHTDEAEDENHLALALQAKLPAAYPSVVPEVAVEVVRGLSAEQCGEVGTLCDTCAAANLGTAMIFAIADEVGDWLRVHNAPAAGAAAAYDEGGGLRRQGSSGGADESGAAVEYRKGQRRKQRLEAKRLRKVQRRPGAIAIGSDVEVMARNASAWLPAEILDEPSAGVYSVVLYNGQHMEQVPKDRVRPKRLASRFLPASALSDAVAATRAGAASVEGPRVLLPTNGRWAQREVRARQVKGGSAAAQFESPQPEAAQGLAPHTLPELHETMTALARTAVGAGAEPARPRQGKLPAQPARGYRYVTSENVLKPALLKAFRARLKVSSSSFYIIIIVTAADLVPSAEGDAGALRGARAHADGAHRRVPRHPLPQQPGQDNRARAAGAGRSDGCDRRVSAGRARRVLGAGRVLHAGCGPHKLLRLQRPVCTRRERIYTLYTRRSLKPCTAGSAGSRRCTAWWRPAPRTCSTLRPRSTTTRAGRRPRPGPCCARTSRTRRSTRSGCTRSSAASTRLRCGRPRRSRASGCVG